MEKTKDIFNIIKKSTIIIFKINKILLLFSIIFFTVVFITHFILKGYNLQFIQWVYSTAIIILAICLAIRIIEIFIKQSKKVKLAIGYICTALITVGIIFWKKVISVLFCLIFLIFMIPFNSEHIVERNGSKYVAEVDSEFTHTTVYFYKYINIFIRSTKVEFEEHYKGTRDPIIRENIEVSY